MRYYTIYVFGAETDVLQIGRLHETGDERWWHSFVRKLPNPAATNSRPTLQTKCVPVKVTRLVFLEFVISPGILDPNVLLLRAELKRPLWL